MRRKVKHALLVLALLWAAPASAQDPGEEPPPETDVEAESSLDEAAGAGSGDSASEAAAEPPVDEAADEDAPADSEAAREEARERFMQGVALARVGNCRGALAELDASYALFPRPNTLFNIAQCQEELHRYDLAVSAYERYLEAAPEDDPERPTVVATMRALRNLLGTIRIEANTTAEVWLDDRVVGEAPGEVLVPGGAHVLELRASGYLAQRQEVQVTARRTVELEVELEVAEETVVEQHTTVEQTTIEQTTIAQTVERPPLPAGVFWGGVALTVVTAGIGGYFGFSALTQASTERERDVRLPPDTAGIEESALLADVFYATAFVFGVATVIVALFTDWDPPAEADGESEADPEEPSARWTGLGVEGAF